MKKLVVLMGLLNVVLLAVMGYLLFGRVDPCVRVEELKTEIQEKYSTPLTQEEREQEIRAALWASRPPSKQTDWFDFPVPSSDPKPVAPNNPVDESEVDAEVIARIDAMTVFRPDLVPKRVERQRLTAIFQCQRSMNR